MSSIESVPSDVDVLRLVQRSPMRTVRTRDLAGVVSNPARTLARLVDRGALRRLAHGTYIAPPDGQNGSAWRPSLEETAAAVATSRFGLRRVILMGVSAARYWGAIPRAVGVAEVAVPRPGYAPLRREDGATVWFVPRDVDRLDAVLQPAEVGMVLVATRAQTVYDILTHPGRADTVGERDSAVQNLSTRISLAELSRVVKTMGRAAPAVRAQLASLEEDSDARVG